VVVDISVKPIFFNTEMVVATLKGLKTTTRKLLKGDKNQNGWLNRAGQDQIIADRSFGKNKDDSWCQLWVDEIGNPLTCVKPPYKRGDILWVRETWSTTDTCGLYPNWESTGIHYMYKADAPYSEAAKEARWFPSSHMPKVAARIFLEVESVHPERLQEITEEGAADEGTDWLSDACYSDNGWSPTFYDPDSGGDPVLIDGFAYMWDSTIQETELYKYMWDSNPWVWVVRFKRCEKPSNWLAQCTK
jgi:hypothetical protein